MQANTNVLGFWNSVKATFPTLSKLEIALLPYPASTDVVQRSLSFPGCATQGRRNGIDEGRRSLAHREHALVSCTMVHMALTGCLLVCVENDATLNNFSMANQEMSSPKIIIEVNTQCFCAKNQHPQAEKCFHQQNRRNCTAKYANRGVRCNPLLL